MEWKHLRALLLNRHHDRRDRRQKPNPRAAIPVTRLAALLLLSLFLELASGVLWINYQPARTTFELTPLAYSRGFILLLVLGRCFLLIL